MRKRRKPMLSPKIQIMTTLKRRDKLKKQIEKLQSRTMQITSNSKKLELEKRIRKLQIRLRNVRTKDSKLWKKYPDKYSKYERDRRTKPLSRGEYIDLD